MVIGLNFVIYLSTSGLLYSMGDNSEGQLGQGDLFYRKNPSLIENLKLAGEKITQLQVGLKHAICKTSIGKVFTWGWGSKGLI